MTDDEREKVKEEYQALCHAMQSGVAMEMNYDPGPTQAKHLRVGVNSALTNQEGLAKLLMDKGVFTEDEYLVAMRDAMREEVARHKILIQEFIKDKTGKDVEITLG